MWRAGRRAVWRRYGGGCGADQGRARGGGRQSSFEKTGKGTMRAAKAVRRGSALNSGRTHRVEGTRVLCAAGVVQREAGILQKLSGTNLFSDAAPRLRAAPQLVKE